MKTLIVGASGKIGKFFKNEKNFILTYNQTKISQGIKFDICKDDISKVIKKYKINKIVLLSAISDPDKCYLNKNLSYQINIKYTKKFIDKIKKENIYLIFMSSEFVYSGFKKINNENNITNPINLYGKQKIEIEKYVKKNLNKFSIFRLAKTYGDDFYLKGLISSFLQEIIKGKNNFIAAEDQIFNPLYVKDLKKIIIFFLKKEVHGVFNIGGPKSLSRFRVYKIIEKKLKQKFPDFKIKVNKIKINSLKFAERRPRNLSLDIKKLKNTVKFELTHIEKIIKIMVNKFNVKELERRQKSKD